MMPARLAIALQALVLRIDQAIVTVYGSAMLMPRSMSIHSTNKDQHNEQGYLDA